MLKRRRRNKDKLEDEESKRGNDILYRSVWLISEYHAGLASGDENIEKLGVKTFLMYTQI